MSEDEDNMTSESSEDEDFFPKRKRRCLLESSSEDEENIIRKYYGLKKCSVVLHRVTDEEIHKSYASFHCDKEISDDIKSKTEELLCKTVEAMSASEAAAVAEASEVAGMQVTSRKDGSRRRMRESKNNQELFENYKQKRQGFLNRKTRSSQSENSLDWSQDEFRALSDERKAKKKLKRGRKYEHDYEWSPTNSRNSVQRTRTLRRRTRKPIFESETSSTDEDEFLFNTFINGDNDYTYPKTTFQNTVPSENNFSTSLNSSEKCGTSNANEISDVNLNSTLNKSSSSSGDILTGIINDMNQLQNHGITPPLKNTLQTDNATNNNVKKPIRRKRLKLTKKDDVSKEVGLLLRKMVGSVSSQLKHLGKGKPKNLKACKWCTTPFSTSKASEMLCPICRDFGMDGKGKSASANKKVKPLKENKGNKKVNKTMTRLLKNLPKNERQRLTYAEKVDKPAEKGYNHCKSFTTPKDTDQNLNTASEEINEPKKKNKLKRKRENSSITNEDKITKVPTPVKLNKQMKVAASNNKDNQKKNCVSLKKFEDGLFLMTFPDPDEELDILDKTSRPQKGRGRGSANNNPKPVGTTSKNSLVTCSNTKQLQPANNKQYDTYLFPPVPTVIVSNYSSDTNNLNLSHTYYQNEITHQHAHKNSNVLLIKNSNEGKNTSIAKNVASNSNNVSYQNPSLTTSNLLPNTSLTITAIPISEGLKQTFAVTPVQTSVVTNINFLPVISDVRSVPNTTQANAVKENVSSNTSIFSSNNSNNLQIKMSGVASQKKDSVAVKSYALRSKTGGTNVNKQTESTVPSVKPLTRKRRNTNASECSDTSEYEDTSSHTDPNRTSTRLERSKSVENSNISDDKSKSKSDTEDNSEKFDNSNPTKPPSVIDVLDAVSILAVIDLEKNPHSGLNVRIQIARSTLQKLNSEKNVTPEYNRRLADCKNNLMLLNIAKKYLNIYGSFTKVSDYLLRRAQMTQMIQIKKEIFEETTQQQSSCMFSQSSQSNNSLSSNSSDATRSTETPNVTTKTNNLNSCKLNDQTSINHIEKLQSQIAAMNGTQQYHNGYEILPSSGTIHHYAAEQITGLPPAVAAPTPVTPRNDCSVGESRETPSRGSGPRTPARPESAASQSEEQSLIQIKKEQLEAASSPPSQCAFSQNTTSPQVSSQLPVVQQMSSLNTMPVSNNTVNLPVSSTNQTNLHLQSRELSQNKTVAYNNNQNYSDVLLNITTKHPLSVTSVTPNQQMNQNRSVLLGQQMFVQNGSGIGNALCSKQAVPSVNTNQYVIRPPYSTANTGGTVIVNNPQVGQNALLTNVSNQQFYTTNQVSQLYYPPSSQITCIPSSNISTMSIPDIGATQIQQADLESQEHMKCAVCQKPATLRCKQCARVAYCNTTCAKTYWHQRHKMECKPLGS